MIKDGVKLKPREEFYYARELYYHGYYKKSIKIFNKFINSEKGWIENNIEACLNISKCYKEINDEKNTLRYLFRSFEYDLPRAEICCEIGLYYFVRREYKKSIYWYQKATEVEMNLESGAFIMSDYYGYIPYIQLCLCYSNIGEIDKANYYNNKAGEIKPNDRAYLHNKSYFENLK